SIAGVTTTAGGGGAADACGLGEAPRKVIRAARATQSPATASSATQRITPAPLDPLTVTCVRSFMRSSYAGSGHWCGNGCVRRFLPPERVPDWWIIRERPPRLPRGAHAGHPGGQVQ